MLSHLIQKLPLADEQCTETPGRNVKFSNTCVRKQGEQAMQKEIHFAMSVTIKIKLVPYNFRPSLV